MPRGLDFIRGVLKAAEGKKKNTKVKATESTTGTTTTKADEVCFLSNDLVLVVAVFATATSVLVCATVFVFAFTFGSYVLLRQPNPCMKI